MWGRLCWTCVLPTLNSSTRTGGHTLRFPVSFFCCTLLYMTKCVCRCVCVHTRALLSLWYPPAPLISVSIPTPNPADTVLDNYSLLISPAVCCPDTMFSILVGHLVVHHSLHFLGGRVPPRAALPAPTDRFLSTTTRSPHPIP